MTFIQSYLTATGIGTFILGAIVLFYWMIKDIQNSK